VVSRLSLREAVVARLGVDERALAAFRVALAVVVLIDLAFAALDATAFYTDAGVLPRSLLYAEFPVRGALSLHSLSGALWWQCVLFACLALAAVAMAVGYRSRLAAAVTLLLVLSMGFRNPLVLNSGHSLLRQLLVWSVLLPVGARWSVDARRRANDAAAGNADATATDAAAGDADAGPRLVTSVATVGLFVQVLVVYGMNAILKSRGRAWTSGDAVELVFGMDALTVALGDVLAGQSLLLELGTHAWVALLYATPLLVLATGRLRTLVVGAFASAHLGMALTLSLGVFPLVSITGLLVFLPSFVWNRVERVVDARLATVVDAHLPPAADRTLTVLDRPTATTPWSAAGVSESVGATLHFLRSAGRTAYRVAPVVLLVGVLVWNAAGFGLLALPTPVTDTIDPTEHRWDMFAPNPLSTDAWYETVGTTTSAQRVDAYAGTAGLGPPEDVDGTYSSQKWYLYLRNLRAGDADARRVRLGAYLCERWNRRHDSTLANVSLALVIVDVALDAPNEVEREPFGTTECDPDTTNAVASGGEPKRISVVAPHITP
jgi:hypothetical protein